MPSQPAREPSFLRRAAEDRLQEKGTIARPSSAADWHQLALDYEMRLIELEIQNEELKQSLAESQTAHDLASELIELAPVGYFEISPDSTIHKVNECGANLIGMKRDQLNQVRFVSLIDPPARAAFEGFLTQIFASEASGTCDITLDVHGHTPLFVNVHAQRSNDGAKSQLILIDITERSRMEMIVSCRTSVLQSIVAGTPLSVTLESILQKIEIFSPDMFGSVLLLDADGKRLRHGASIRLPHAYCHAVDGIEIGPIAGSCGTAAFTGQQVIVEDISTDPLWKNYRDLALSHDLRACWSTPIIDSQQRVLGTFAMYYQKPGKPTAAHFQCIDLVTDLVAIAIERERSEQALIRSEIRYRRLVESNIIGVLIARTDGSIIEVNDCLLQMIGYSRHEFEAGVLRWDELTPREWDIVDAKAVEQIRSSGTCAPFEKEYFRKDGSRVRILAAAARLDGDSGDCICLVADITKRREAEAAMQRYETIFQQAGWGMVIADPDTHALTHVNPAFAHLHGYTVPEMIGMHLSDVFAKDSLEDLPQHAEIVHDRGHYVYECIHRRKDGSVFPCLSDVTAFKDATGRVLFRAATFEDITERRLVELRLRRSEELLRAVVDTSPHILCVKDVESRILLANAAVASFYGLSTDDIIGRIQSELHAEKGHDSEEIKKWLRDDLYVIETGESFETVETITDRFGQTKILQTDKFPIDLQDDLRGVLVISQDITARRQAELEIQTLNSELERRVAERTSQMEEANKGLQIANSELEAFSYSVSHDLRAPLRGIDSFTRIVMDEYAPSLDAEAQRLLTIVRQETQRMGQLIDDLLRFSGIGRQPFKMAKFNMHELALGVVNHLRSGTAVAAAEFKISELPVVFGDLAMIRQVLVNLVSNALKFTRPGILPEIRIASQRIQEAWTFTVQDNGVGFDPRYSSKLFGVFQRLHTEAEFEGTGVGLALVKRIINRHGGEVWADGKLDQGATFYFTIPDLKEPNFGDRIS